MGLIIVKKMVRFTLFFWSYWFVMLCWYIFLSLCLIHFQLIKTIFCNCRRKLGQLVGFVIKDWQICLVVVVKAMRGCSWLNICPMKHLQNTFSIVIAHFMHVSSFLRLLSNDLIFLWYFQFVFLCFSLWIKFTLLICWQVLCFFL